MNVGNNCGTSRPPFVGFQRFQNWQMYNHCLNFQLILPSCFQQKVDKVVKIVPTIVLGSITENFVSYSIQIMSLQTSKRRKMGRLPLPSMSFFDAFTATAFFYQFQLIPFG